MSIGLSDDHAELAASVRKWAESMSPRESARAAEGHPESLSQWGDRYAEMGLASIALPEAMGGGGSILDQAVALEAAAYALVPGPLLSTTIGGLLVSEELGAGVAEGSVRFGIAMANETDSVVLDGPTATHMLLPAGGPQSGWGVVPVERAALRIGSSPDLGRGMSILDTAVDVPEVVAASDGQVRRLMLTLASAEASGVARWCLDTAVEYARVREQFGRKIGAFQAIKHLCAEMLEISEAATAAAWDAANAAGEAEQQWELAVRVAATVCFDGAVNAAKACIQVLGGIGFTFEHDAHLYLRRALVLRTLFGSADLSSADPGERLAELAATGVRRSARIEFHGRDEQYRDEARSVATRIGLLPESEQRAALAESGFLAPHWPAPYGLAADPVRQLVIDEELSAAGVVMPDLKIGGWAAPTILEHGSAEQRDRFLMPTLRGEIAWCQLFSEPEAGSDLASLRTRAVKVDGGHELTGQKVWTSLGREADWGICLARTDPDAKPHAGITYFLVDMTSPGLDIRPLRELTGEEMFNEVFLDNVFVPDECVVGEVNGGWRLAVTTLANERVAMAGARLGVSVERAVSLYGEAGPAVRERIGRAVALATVVKLLATRVTLRSLAGQQPGAESSVAKLLGVRSRQDSAELVVELLGSAAFRDDDLASEAMHELLLTRCLSIAGGTTQVLRNVVGERILGLPRG